MRWYGSNGMGAILLIAVGAGVAAGTVLVAHRTRPRRASQPAPLEPVAVPPIAFDPWTAPTEPLPAVVLESPPRRRVWPAAGVLAGLALAGAGIVAARSGSGHVPVRSPRPFLIELGSPSAAAEGAESPLPEGTPSPAPGASATVRPSPSRSSAPSQATPRTTPRPATPTPVSGEGPTLGASTSCFGTTSSPSASISYSAQARPPSRLASLTVSFDGRTIQRPNVYGRTSYSGQAPTQTTTPGHHEFTITATDTSGGATTQTMGVTCG